ncbi:glycosyltransferase family 2 protein [Microbulbifer taiwanensis]|uniref:Glycosyltransferase family 2 protein n=1 Tax=Microbulbifer taiwanensis TaxID=986746 RepID=A0ABW1YQ12_9GAMM|nr:glycosyltransferase family 2 protein [Microbulbifer taiwanensis]
MKLSLVVPVYNEEETIALFYSAVRNSALLADHQIEIVFINDGSTDETELVATSLASRDPQVVLLNLSRNFGKEAALFAGIEHASGDAIIPMDVDLQDPIEVIPEMIAKWQDGADVVLAKRVDRSRDGYLKRRSASLFYKINNSVSETKIEENVGDFRLMSRQVVESIRQLPERKLFMKGILSWVGYRTAIVEYARAERVAGKSKFNGWKLWNLALEGITSFSTVPLRIWTYIGLSIAFVSLIYAAWMVADKLIWGNPVPGYPSLITAVLFLGGVQLIGIGVIGEYIGRIYMETKARPRYIIRDTVNFGSNGTAGKSRRAQLESIADA